MIYCEADTWNLLWNICCLLRALLKGYIYSTFEEHQNWESEIPIDTLIWIGLECGTFEYAHILQCSVDFHPFKIEKRFLGLAFN